jgi:4-hydroxyphenylacetate 3-monooxygenase
MRTGQQYTNSLSDGRAVFIEGSRVKAVTENQAFQGIAATLSTLYDVAADPRNGMSFTSPETGRKANKVFMIPRSRDDLAERRRAITTWAEVSKGFIGRSPDHVGGFLAGFASSPETFNDGPHSFGKDVVSFYRKVLDEDLFVTYVIIPPQANQGVGLHGWKEERLQVGVAREEESGIVVRGAQMLGTGTAVSDYLFVSCIKPLTSQDRRCALSFVVPVAARGLKIYCRKPYVTSQTSRFDYPLTARFDETDALVVFEDVFVPWEDVFVYCNPEKVRNQFFLTPAHVLGNSQAQIRLTVKMKFLLGVARKIAQFNAIDGIPSVQEKLGELASLASVIEGMVLAAETACVTDSNGVVKPNPRFLYAAMGMQAEVYPRAIFLLRELAGGGVIQLPSSYRDFVSEITKADVECYQQSPHGSPEERVKLFKLAWDIVGSEFAGRHLQYEMFYAGAPFVARNYAFRNYGYDEAVQSAESFLSSYGLESLPDPGEPSGKQA